jgi:hypothetical protein
MNKQLCDLFDPKNITDQIVFDKSEDYQDIIIKAKYSDDLNIIKIHEMIKYKFINDETQEKSDWYKYFNSVKDILLEYIPLASNKSKGIINIGISNKDEEKFSSEKILNRLILIKKYLNVSSNYIKLDILWKIEIDSVCKICGYFFENQDIDQCDEYFCKCGNTNEPQNVSEVKHFKNNDNSFQSFKKGLDKYEGNFQIKFPSYLFSDLNKYFIEKGFKHNTYYQTLQLNSFGKKDGTNLKMLIEALHETKNSSFFHVINIIAYNYWGWNLPNLSNLREKILDQYKQTQEIYEKIKKRDSNLNINIRIYAHLKSLDFDCNYDDFKMLTTSSAINYHNEMLKIMFEECNLKYIPII